MKSAELEALGRTSWWKIDGLIKKIKTSKEYSELWKNNSGQYNDVTIAFTCFLERIFIGLWFQSKKCISVLHFIVRNCKIQIGWK